MDDSDFQFKDFRGKTAVCALNALDTGLGRAADDIFRFLRKHRAHDVDYIDFSGRKSFMTKFFYIHGWARLFKYTDLVACSLPPLTWALVPRRFHLVVFDVYAREEGQLKGKLFDLAWKFWILRAQTIIPVSESIKMQLVEHYSVAPAPPLLRSFKFSPLTSFERTQDTLRVLIITSKKKNKNHHLLYEIVNNCKLNIKFFLVGADNSFRYFENVFFLNNLKQSEIIELYGLCDVYLCTSFDEGFCYPVLDAKAFGLWILTTDIPIFHEWLSGYPKWRSIDEFVSSEPFVVALNDIAKQDLIQ